MSEDTQELQSLSGALWGSREREIWLLKGIARVIPCFDRQIKANSHFSTVHVLSQNVSDFNHVHAQLCTGNSKEGTLPTSLLRDAVLPYCCRCTPNQFRLDRPFHLEYEWTKSVEEEKKLTPSFLVGVYTAQAGWAPNRFPGAGLRKELVQLSQAVEYITTRRGSTAQTKQSSRSLNYPPRLPASLMGYAKWFGNTETGNVHKNMTLGWKSEGSMSYWVKEMTVNGHQSSESPMIRTLA